MNTLSSITISTLVIGGTILFVETLGYINVHSTEGLIAFVVGIVIIAELIVPLLNIILFPFILLTLGTIKIVITSSLAIGLAYITEVITDSLLVMGICAVASYNVYILIRKII